MQDIRTFFRPALVLAALMALLILGLPSHARAQTAVTVNASTVIGQNMTALDNNLHGLMGGVVNQRNTATYNIYGRINSQLSACWNKIQAAFALIGGFNNIIAALFKVLVNQVMQLVLQVCQMALSLTSQITQYVQRELQSLTCIPVPKLFKLNQINLGLTPPPPCNGIPILGVPNTGAHKWIQYPSIKFPDVGTGTGGPPAQQ